MPRSQESQRNREPKQGPNITGRARHSANVKLHAPEQGQEQERVDVRHLKMVVLTATTPYEEPESEPDIFERPLCEAPVLRGDCDCGKPLCKHFAQGNCTHNKCKYCPCNHMGRSDIACTRHRRNPPQFYYERDVMSWTLREVAAAVAAAFGLDMERAGQSLRHLTLEKAVVVKEAIGIHSRSPTLANTVYCKVAKHLRREGKLWQKPAEVLEQAVDAPFPRLWSRGAPGSRDSQWPLRRLWQELFCRASVRPELGDLWRTCGWQWPTKEDFPLGHSPWSGFVNQLHWCIALVQLRLVTERGGQACALVLRGQRAEEYFVRLRQQQAIYFQ